jgi:hypothetical protein
MTVNEGNQMSKETNQAAKNLVTNEALKHAYDLGVQRGHTEILELIKTYAEKSTDPVAATAVLKAGLLIMQAIKETPEATE